MWTINPAIAVNPAYSSVPLPPVSLAAAVGAEKIPAGRAEILPPRVLVVDDEALVRWSLAETFGKAGYDVAEAGSRRAAAAVLADASLPIAAMVLDMKLPDGHGLDVLEEARRFNRFCPAIVITAFGSSDVAERALTLGAVAIVPKPFDLDQLLDIVKRVCPLA